MHEYAIETKNLGKRFLLAKSTRQFILNPLGKAKVVVAVNQVNLKIKKTELFALVGPNGAGKTTLIKMLACLILPSEGSAEVNGFDIVKEEMRVKSSIGLLTGEERSFYWRLTGRENLNFFATLYNLSREKAKQRIEQLTQLLRIEELDKRFLEYSTGMKQRLAIARSLLNDPAVLLMDEPTRQLDPIAAEDLRQLIKKRLVEQQRKTILFCTHNLSEAASLGSRIAIMDKGRLKASGTLDELIKNAHLSPGVSLEDVFKYYVVK